MLQNKHIRKNLIVVFVMAFTIISSGQISTDHLENKHWHFSDQVGLKFSYTGAFPDDFVQLSTGHHDMSASISNSRGEFLFSAAPNFPHDNTIKVWNKTSLMSSSITLQYQSGLKSLIIVPYPSNDNLYYLFYADGETPLHYHYASIDMSKNCGNGEVVDKGYVSDLLNYSNISKGRMVSATHANGNDYWLIINQGNEFNALLIDRFANIENGTANNIWNVTPSNLPDEQDSTTMSISKDGTKIVYANKIGDDYKVKIFSFDKQTGIVTFLKEYIINDNMYVLSVDFSGSGEYVYILEDSMSDSKRIIRYDINSTSTSSTIIATTDSYSHPHAVIRRAMNDKLYVTTWYAETALDGLNKIAVINEPNSSSAAVNGSITLNFVHDDEKEAENLPHIVPTYCCPYDWWYEETGNDILEGMDVDKKVSHTIYAKNTIKGPGPCSSIGAKAEYDAKNEVWLEPGFYVEHHAEFYAHIGGCNANCIIMMDGDVDDIGGPYDGAKVSNNPKINIYPNPTKDKVTVQGDKIIIEWALYYLNKSTYHEVLSKPNKTIHVDLNDYPKGLYYLKVFYEDGQSQIRTIIKE